MMVGAAAVVGIPVAMLLTWLEIHPEMEQARARVAGRDLEILESLEATAIGERNPETGKYDKGNPALLMLLARTRLGMHEPKETKGDVADMRTPAEIHRPVLPRPPRLTPTPPKSCAFPGAWRSTCRVYVPRRPGAEVSKRR